MDDIKQIDLLYILGFSGKIPDCFHVCHINNSIVYPCVNKIIVQEIRNGAQFFLECESQPITSTALSSCETFVAASYLPRPGFKALISVWNIVDRSQYLKYESHRDKVHSLTFSLCGKFVISVGGFDEDNSIIFYDLKNKKVLFGANAKSSISGDSTKIATLKFKNYTGFSAGENILRLWAVGNNKLTYNDAHFFKVKRNILCTQINQNSTLIYCGTFAGDIIKFRLNSKPDVLSEFEVTFLGCFGKVIIKKKLNVITYEAKKYELGVTSILSLEKDEELLIGSGSGILEAVVQKDGLKKSCVTKPSGLSVTTLPLFIKKKSVNLKSRITAIKPFKADFFVSTEKNEIFKISNDDFGIRIVINSFPSISISVVYPCDNAELFSTTCRNSIRLWRMNEYIPAMEITVGDTICHSATFLRNGTIVVSFWNDGYVRGHTTDTAKLLHQIRTFQEPGYAIIYSSANNSILVGGENGQIVFAQLSETDKLTITAKISKHTGKILSVHSNLAGTQSATCATDGLIIIWNTELKQSKRIIFSNTVTNCVKFHPNLNNLVSCGNDKKIKIWDTENGTLLKSVEGSLSSSLSSIDISRDGMYLLSAAINNIIKVWSYNDDNVIAVNLDNTEHISNIHFSPDQKFIITCTTTGCVVLYKNPCQVL